MVAATINFLSMVVEKMVYHLLRPFMVKCQTTLFV